LVQVCSWTTVEWFVNDLDKHHGAENPCDVDSGPLAR